MERAEIELSRALPAKFAKTLESTEKGDGLLDGVDAVSECGMTGSASDLQVRGDDTAATVPEGPETAVDHDCGIRLGQVVNAGHAAASSTVTFFLYDTAADHGPVQVEVCVTQGSDGLEHDGHAAFVVGRASAPQASISHFAGEGIAVIVIDRHSVHVGVDQKGRALAGAEAECADDVGAPPTDSFARPQYPIPAEDLFRTLHAFGPSPEPLESCFSDHLAGQLASRIAIPGVGIHGWGADQVGAGLDESISINAFEEAFLRLSQHGKRPVGGEYCALWTKFPKWRRRPASSSYKRTASS